MNLDHFVAIFTTMNKIENLQIFCRVTELGSYSEVARERHMSRSSISRVITDLEKQFAVQLFKRTTRSLQLTDAGKELYEESERLIRQFEAIQDRLSRNRTQVKGLLRVGVPGPLSQRFILPDLPLFSKSFPDISLFFKVSENLSDLYKDELDLIIRMGPMRDSSLMAVKISDLDIILAASPDYLVENSISHPNDLKSQNCLCFRGRGRGTNWTFESGSRKAKVSVRGNFAADCGYSLRDTATAGIGIVAMPKPLIKNELESGLLIRLLPDWEIVSSGSDWSIHILYHQDRQQLNRVRAFIDFFKSSDRLLHSCNI